MNTKENFRISIPKIDLPSLAAIRDGNGGQQNKQHRSRTESVFIVQSSEKQKKKNILSNLQFLYCLIRLSRIQNTHILSILTIDDAYNHMALFYKAKTNEKDCFWLEEEEKMWSVSNFDRCERLSILYRIIHVF